MDELKFEKLGYMDTFIKMSSENIKLKVCNFCKVFNVYVSTYIEVAVLKLVYMRSMTFRFIARKQEKVCTHSTKSNLISLLFALFRLNIFLEEAIKTSFKFGEVMIEDLPQRSRVQNAVSIITRSRRR